MTRVGDLSTLGDQVGRPVPKPEARVVDKDAARKAASQREKEFRRAVWQRDQGHCRYCGIRVLRTMELVSNRGEVHHVKPRSLSPEKKYDPLNGKLACHTCHEKVTRHQR